MPADLTLVVIAKEPVPGLVKTRLTPPCTPTAAAQIAEASLADTLSIVAATPAKRRVLALAGRPGRWLPNGFDVVAQVSGTLDVRIAGVLAAVRGPMVLVGMDTPQVTPDLLLACDFAARDAWLGRAEDGGFWALGLTRPAPELVRGVPMSVPHTYTAQLERLEQAGLSVGQLPVLRDVDTWPDALAVADLAPATAFARTIATLSMAATR